MKDETDKIGQILEGHSPDIVALAESLRALVHETVPGLTEEAKPGWGNITYKKNGVVCAISPHKQHVNLHFYKGVHLSDPQGLLAGSGKALRHVKVQQPADIQAEAIKQLIQEAVKLDNE